MSVDTCEHRHGSVYRRPGNVSVVLSNPEFLKAIEELTVNAKTTKTAQRKLISVWDSRASVVTTGSMAAVTVIIVIVCFLTIMDLPRLIQCKQNCRTRRIRRHRVTSSVI